MKTPFCAAVRMAEQAVEEIRVAIAEAQEELTCLEGRSATLTAAQAAERAIAARPLAHPATGWFDRQAQRRAELRRRCEEVEGLLGSLRAEAAGRLGPLKALQSAADRYRAAERKRLARREQAHADDRSAALFLGTIAAEHRAGLRS